MSPRFNSRDSTPTVDVVSGDTHRRGEAIAGKYAFMASHSLPVWPHAARSQLLQHGSAHCIDMRGMGCARWDWPEAAAGATSASAWEAKDAKPPLDSGAAGAGAL